MRIVRELKLKENTIKDKLKALSVLGVTRASLVGPLGAVVEDNSNGRQTWEAGLGETAQGLLLSVLFCIFDSSFLIFLNLRLK